MFYTFNLTGSLFKRHIVFLNVRIFILNQFLYKLFNYIIIPIYKNSDYKLSLVKYYLLNFKNKMKEFYSNIEWLILFLSL